MQDIIQIKEVAINAAVSAGKFILENVGEIKEISYKDGINNLVTNVDKASEKMIIDIINAEFPSHSILAEESGENIADGSVKWIIDPLDGTTNYAHALPAFCVSIGVSVDEAIKVGVVYDPCRDELFVAEEGKGAFLNNEQISVSKTEKVQGSLMATGFAYSTEGKIANIDHFEKMLNKAQAVRRIGSAAIDLCYVACGRFDGFWELGLSPWDTVAGQLIVKEAGGVVTMIRDNEFNIYEKEIAASNGKIHEEMLRLLKN